MLDQPEKSVFAFGRGKADPAVDETSRLGGKGANLAEMSRIGLPVPPGFTISTDMCRAYLESGRRLPPGLKEQVETAMAALEKVTKQKLGCLKNPLLVSVRSGAQVSMPGMMDTVLNLGLNDETVEALAKRTKDPRFAYDTYRRFIQMYATVVIGVPHELFEERLEGARDLAGVERDDELDVEALKKLIIGYLIDIEADMDDPFPQDPQEQLWGAIKAVFSSWKNPRAVTYRALHGIPDEWGTAVTVQMMVFGNSGPESATGVAFTRDPSTGERRFFGEYLLNAQGEDIVAGTRTPDPLQPDPARKRKSMREKLPHSFSQLQQLASMLESHFGDMQDIEFTIDNGSLWILQTRSGKRTINAGIRIAVELAKEKVISKAEAVLRIDPASVDQLIHPMIDPDAARKKLSAGLPASPGAATGAVVLTSDAAVEAAAEGRKVILVRPETSPDDIHGMAAAEGIVTSRGGMTSHAAVVARGMGKPCITSASGLHIDRSKGVARFGRMVVHEGELITLDGSSGEVLLGNVPKVQREVSGDFATLMDWADDVRRMRVRANADSAEDAAIARSFGAQGIGLCRTENMFSNADALHLMRMVIMSESERDRRNLLDRLYAMQRDAFVELFVKMPGQPVCLRLLDPPLEEFLPHDVPRQEAFAKAIKRPVQDVHLRLEQLREINPMLGNRGARLAICYPEIAEMQTRAIIEAAIEAGKASGAPIVPEIVVPLVSYYQELRHLRETLDASAQETMRAHKADIRYLIGCIVEVPRAAIRADLIADAADFFSFGTNDLTQTTLGISRDDASQFLSRYLELGIIEHDPFITVDREGVGDVIKQAIAKGRATKPDLLLGVTGEHGGDPASIAFFEETGIDYVSCSPYRIPVARLAAAQAAVRAERTAKAAAKA
ncbi:MAG: pyruvate, phosphate dikinase [Pseudomonadota bacterium]